MMYARRKKDEEIDNEREGAKGRRESRYTCACEKRGKQL